MHGLKRALVLLAALSLPAMAQQPTRGATIAGTVRDSASQPVSGADVVAQPGSLRTRSDSAGNFILTGLGGGSYTVAARKLGYAPARWDVKVSKASRIDVHFVLGRRITLDTIAVVARRDCPEYSVSGFMCRERDRRFRRRLSRRYP